jgi:hypothetical protein
VNNAIIKPKIIRGICIIVPIKLERRRADAVASLNNTGSKLSTRSQAMDASTTPTNKTEKKASTDKVSIEVCDLNCVST